MKLINQINEETNNKIATAAQIAKILRSDDFGMKTARVSKGNLVITDGWFYGGDDKLKTLIGSWINPAGNMADYFKKEYNVRFQLVDSKSFLHPPAKYKKYFDNGLNEVTLRVLPA